MTQSIHPGTATIPNYHLLQNAHRQRNLQITLLVVVTLSSLVSMAVLPWQVSVPLTMALMLGASGLLFAFDHPNQDFQHPAYIIHTETQHPPTTIVVSEPTYYAPPSIWYAPTAQKVTSYSQSHFEPSHHAPVGTGRMTPMVHHTSRPSSMDQSFLSAARAPVGHR